MNTGWDQRYAVPDYIYGTEPNAFLVSVVRDPSLGFRPGTRALAVGDGEGRNGVWLAEQGFEVQSVDGSAVASAKAQRLAEQRGVRLTYTVTDLRSWDWPRAEFDLVAAIFIHFLPGDRARMHAAMWQALRPGGLLVLEAFAPEQLAYQTGGPPVREMLYTAETLRADFTGAELLRLEPRVADLSEGTYHRGRAAVVRLVARRPIDQRP